MYDQLVRRERDRQLMLKNSRIGKTGPKKKRKKLAVIKQKIGSFLDVPQLKQKQEGQLRKHISLDEIPSKPLPTLQDDDQVCNPDSSSENNVTLKLIDSQMQLGSENDSGGGGRCFEDQAKEGSSSGGDLGDLNDQTETITKGPSCYQSLKKKVTVSSQILISGPKPYSTKPKQGGLMQNNSPVPIVTTRSLLASAAIKTTRY